MDIQQHSGKQISQEFPPSYQRSQEYSNYSIFPEVSAAEILSSVEEQKQFPTSSTNNSNLLQFQQNNYLTPFEDPTILNNSNSSNISSVNNNSNNNNKNKVKKPKDKSPKLFEDVLIPVTSSAKDGSLFTVLENVPVKRTHRRRSANVDKDSLKCHQCNTSNTPEWRKGPEGPATLCNACGLAYAKKQKLGLLGQGNKSKASTSNKKKGCTTTRSRVFNELVVPTVPSNFPTLTNIPVPVADASSIKKSHTFHEYMTPLNSFYTGKPIKTTKTITKQRSKSKIGKIVPSVHEQPQLTQQVQAAIEKSKLANGFKLSNQLSQQQQQQNSSINFNFSSNVKNSNNNNNNNNISSSNILFSNVNSNSSSNNNNTFNNINTYNNRQPYGNQNNEGGGINNFSPTGNHEHQIQFDFSSNNTMVPNLLQNSNGINSNIYINEQNSYVPFINVNNSNSNNINNSINNSNQNNSNSNNYIQIIPAFTPHQTLDQKSQPILPPQLQIHVQNPSQPHSLNSSQNLQLSQENIQVQQPTLQNLAFQNVNNNIEVKNETSPVSELGSSPTESFNGLTVNTPLNTEGSKLLDCSTTATTSNANFNNNSDYFASMNDTLGGLFGIHANEDMINLELLPNSII